MLSWTIISVCFGRADVIMDDNISVFWRADVIMDDNISVFWEG